MNILRSSEDVLKLSDVANLCVCACVCVSNRPSDLTKRTSQHRSKHRINNHFLQQHESWYEQVRADESQIQFSLTSFVASRIHRKEKCFEPTRFEHSLHVEAETFSSLHPILLWKIRLNSDQTRLRDTGYVHYRTATENAPQVMWTVLCFSRHFESVIFYCSTPEQRK